MDIAIFLSDTALLITVVDGGVTARSATRLELQLQLARPSASAIGHKCHLLHVYKMSLVALITLFSNSMTSARRQQQCSI